MNRNFLIDTHTHTIVSGHAYNTINEMLEYAAYKNVEVLCITEHGPTIPGSANKYYFSNLKIIPEDYKPFNHLNNTKYPKLILGIEANILNFNGRTDYEDVEDFTNSIKYIIASMHKPCITPGNEKENTNAYINAMKNPYVSVLGHIDDGYFPCNYEKIIKKAKELNVLIEVNNSSNSKNSFRINSKENTLEYLQLCKETETMIILGSDAHYYGDICNFSNVIPLLDKVNFPNELIINSNKELFLKFINDKYQKRLSLLKK